MEKLRLALVGEENSNFLPGKMREGGMTAAVVGHSLPYD